MKPAFKVSLTVILSLSLILSSCGTVATNSQVVQSDKQVTSYSGEQIMQGLFFGQGAVANLFPEIWQDPEVKEMLSKLTPEDKISSDHAVQQIMTGLSKKYPDFFDGFGKAMRSGNQVVIADALDDAANKVGVVAEGLKMEAMNGRTEAGKPNCAVTVLVAVAAGAVYTLGVVYSYGAIAVAVAAVAVKVKFWAANPQTSALERDFFVNRIAERLH